jgi:hypothetical protein
MVYIVVAAIYFAIASRSRSGVVTWKGTSVPLVELDSVAKRFGTTMVLDGVSLTVEPDPMQYKGDYSWACPPPRSQLLSQSPRPGYTVERSDPAIG